MSAQLYPPDQVSQQFLITLWWEDPLHQVATLSMLDASGLAVNLIRHCRTKVVCPYGIWVGPWIGANQEAHLPAFPIRWKGILPGEFDVEAIYLSFVEGNATK